MDQKKNTQKEDKINITVLIMTQNSEEYLKRALDSVINFEEVVIADGFSKDKTKIIAQSYPNVVFIENRFKGFTEQRNFLISKASKEWCLFLDSDEAVTPELEKELYKELQKKNNHHLLYKIVRTEYLQHKEIKCGHGGSGHQERFFKKDHIQYHGLVHEYPLVNGKKITIESEKMGVINKNARLLHYPNVTTKSMLTKSITYAILRAEQRIESGRKTNAFIVILSFIGTFFQIWLKGLKNGKRGFILAVLEAFHRCAAKLLIYENQLINEEKNKNK